MYVYHKTTFVHVHATAQNSTLSIVLHTMLNESDDPLLVEFLARFVTETN